jgi:hypothetical protein
MEANLPGEALTDRASLGPSSTCRANGKAVERTRVPSRRSEPRLFTAALRRLHRSRTKASIFHTYGGVTLDGVHRRTRGREAAPVAQHATGTICLRASKRRSAKRVAREQMCRELRVHSSDTNRHDQAKNKAKSNFFVHRMCARFQTPSSHVVCNLRALHTFTHQDVHSLSSGSDRDLLLPRLQGRSSFGLRPKRLIRPRFRSHFCSLWIRGTIFDYRRHVPITNGLPRPCLSNSTP